MIAANKDRLVLLKSVNNPPCDTFRLPVLRCVQPTRSNLSPKVLPAPICQRCAGVYGKPRAFVLPVGNSLAPDSDSRVGAYLPFLRVVEQKPRVGAHVQRRDRRYLRWTTSARISVVRHSKTTLEGAARFRSVTCGCQTTCHAGLLSKNHSEGVAWEGLKEQTKRSPSGDKRYLPETERSVITAGDTGQEHPTEIENVSKRFILHTLTVSHTK